jgi:hypothetical protein
VLVAFFAIGVAALFYFLMYGRYFDIRTIVRSNEAKRHAINMAQVLLSSDKLVYEEEFDDGSKRFHRAVFDKAKLDAELVKQSELIPAILGSKSKELIESVSYPDTMTKIVVTDVDEGNTWVRAFGHPGVSGVSQLVKCMYDKVNVNIFTITGFVSPWNNWDSKQCFKTYGSNMGMFNQEFPVMIYANGEMHAGRLYVGVLEF